MLLLNSNNFPLSTHAINNTLYDEHCANRICVQLNRPATTTLTNFQVQLIDRIIRVPVRSPNQWHRWRRRHCSRWLPCVATLDRIVLVAAVKLIAVVVIIRTAAAAAASSRNRSMRLHFRLSFPLLCSRRRCCRRCHHLMLVLCAAGTLSVSATFKVVVRIDLCLGRRFLVRIAAQT